MDAAATFWMALGSIGSAVGVAVGLGVHVVRVAYKQGVTDTRISTLEVAVAEAAGVKALIAGLQATVEGLTRAVDRLDRATERLDERQSRTRSRAAPAGAEG
jgi:hypothetical protein